MKKLLLLLSPLLLASCILYGEGETYGYIYAVDDGIIWDKVYYKSNLESSETDRYCLREDHKMKEELRSLEPNQHLKLFYKRHLFVFGDCNSDEITSYELLDN